MGCDRTNWSNGEIRKNPFFCPDKNQLNYGKNILWLLENLDPHVGLLLS